MKTTILSALVILGLVFAFAFFGQNENVPPQAENTAPVSQTDNPARVVILSDKARAHILYGNESGGGHLYGTGKPCKSEFPQDWSAERVIETVERVAANDNLDWRRERNDYHVTEVMESDTRVRVVMGPEKRRVITAYPTNVKRNPCPANDN